MKIRVSKGTGSGPTELSAFDQALVRAGVANYNLIYLSSVLPPNSEVVITDSPTPYEGTWGDKLYLVMAQYRVDKPGQEAWAGIGWIQDELTKKGLLVEHEGTNEATVKNDIQNSLKALAQNRNMEFGPINMCVTGVKCESEPVCALVVATFETEPWATAAKPLNGSKKLSFLRKNKG